LRRAKDNGFGIWQFGIKQQNFTGGALAMWITHNAGMWFYAG
jgi:hypothetical protein